MVGAVVAGTELAEGSHLVSAGLVGAVVAGLELTEASHLVNVGLVGVLFAGAALAEATHHRSTWVGLSGISCKTVGHFWMSEPDACSHFLNTGKPRL